LYSVKLEKGINAESYKPGDKFYMGYDDLLPIDRFLPRPKGSKP
jgi:H/ACA ribonucleoprotein complex subunit 1